MNVIFPEFVTGAAPFDLRFTDHKSVHPDWRNDKITVWMLSTKMQLKHVKFGPYPCIYPFYWDTPEVPDEWFNERKYRHEVIFGSQRKHGIIHRRWGTQPITTYLRGHFAIWGEGTYAGNRGTQFVLIQQYFKSGWWGDGDKCTIRNQLEQNEVGIPLLIELGIIREGVGVYFYDQSKPETEIPHGKDPFRLFYGKNCYREYLEWLPTYLKDFRPNDFVIPITEVIENEVRPFY